MDDLIAAIDLGSNSFRLQIARVDKGLIYPVDQLKQSVRLAGGLLPDKTLSHDVKAKALEAVAQFGERLRGFAAERVRAVATNTLRVAHDTGPFVEALEARLGFAIDVISGHEEARLIYLGACETLPPSTAKRLVFDIGGGSTEMIIGRGETPLLLTSAAVGCVTFSQRYFADGVCTKKRLRRAEIAAAQEIEPFCADFHHIGWDEVIATSGTASALAELARANAFCPDVADGLSRAGLEAIREAMLAAYHVDAIKLPGLRQDRVPVLAGGVAVMTAVMETLGIERWRYNEGALRQGVLADLVKRDDAGRDQRQKTVHQLVDERGLDRRQAEAVTATAERLFEQLTAVDTSQVAQTTPASLDSVIHERRAARQWLQWAALLHEIGKAISTISYHKHGAYWLTHADMPGFSRQEQLRLATLVLAHRGKLSKIRLPQPHVDWQLILALRLATVFHRGRSEATLPDTLLIARTSTGYRLLLPPGWLAAHPLTEAGLSDEQQAWQSIGVDLVVE